MVQLAKFLDDLSESEYVTAYRIAEGQDAEPHEAGICGAPTCREPKCIAYRHAMKVAS